MSDQFGFNEDQPLTEDDALEELGEGEPEDQSSERGGGGEEPAAR